MAHLDILSLDIFETQAHLRGIKDTGLFRAIDMRRGVLEREEQP